MIDPRVLFAAERTLLAWNRTSLSFMAFGFLIERSGFFLSGAGQEGMSAAQRDLPFWIGVGFLVLGTCIAVTSMFQYRRIFRTLKTTEVSDDFNLDVGLIANAVTSILGLVLIAFLFLGTR